MTGGVESSVLAFLGLGMVERAVCTQLQLTSDIPEPSLPSDMPKKHKADPVVVYWGDYFGACARSLRRLTCALYVGNGEVIKIALSLAKQPFTVEEPTETPEYKAAHAGVRRPPPHG